MCHRCASKTCRRADRAENPRAPTRRVVVTVYCFRIKGSDSLKIIKYPSLGLKAGSVVSTILSTIVPFPRILRLRACTPALMQKAPRKAGRIEVLSDDKWDFPML
jgi:hypothetical protein